MPEARSSESSRAPEGEWVRLTGEEVYESLKPLSLVSRHPVPRALPRTVGDTSPSGHLESCIAFHRN